MIGDLQGPRAVDAGVALDVAAHRRRGRALRAVASQWRMHYNAGDQLRLATKILPRLPIPGAANVSVMDLIYGSDRDRYRYVFTVSAGARALALVALLRNTGTVVRFRKLYVRTIGLRPGRGPLEQPILMSDEEEGK